MKHHSDADALIGMTCYGSDGEKIGKIIDLYIDNATGEPSWVTLRTGLLGVKESLVPITEATVTDNGLQFPFTKHKVKDAPDIGAEGDLTPQQEAALFQYYGLPYQDPNIHQAGEPVTLQDANPAPPVPRAPAHREPRPDESGYRETQPAMTVPPTPVAPERDNPPTEGTHSETPRPEPQGPRLRRRIVRETQTISVPVEREEFVVEDEDDERRPPPSRR
ncbi:PRC-barrel domain-containing protein [Hoyosella subflava]|uniref:PRC-barrel domain-containing protein n=1 Tax=Hoyosella subflava (strain DSM 45089 / JCM 17490 / NBRC 109087 / DQS3-9A1) TaxID=443218 RepID=F6EPU2_HOYSD|nr:PRC-barrel domain-containing protein [Hoyosella subflava]AEF40571.1 hypothetical protein AS9A_2122 [Hoyosella subflava DQS3-9A1]